MFELIWGILNIGILIGLIVYLIRIFKLIRKESGIISAVFLTFIFIISIVPSNNQDSDSEFRLTEANLTVNKNTKFKRILLSDNTLNKTYINLKFSKDNKLLNASLNRSGLIAFTKVKPNVLNTDELGKNHIKYRIFYSKNWYLLGLIVYRENFDIEKKIQF